MLSFFLLIVVLATAGVIHAEDDCCSSEDKKELAFLWHQVWHTSYTGRKVKIMTEVWNDMVTKHPEAKELLAKNNIASTDTPEFRAYMIAFAHGLDNIINLLDEPLILEEQIHFMAEKYGSKVGLKKSQFEAIVDSMETVLDKVSSCFNVGAWNRCFGRLLTAITEKVHD